ncbi:MAG: sodium:solute symporter family protein [Acidobacteria bacterium]|nr:sodium:solute symporter family protein [Acidobacteriota bacterium]
MLGLHPIDVAIIATYFAIVAYIGIVIGKQKTKNLGDFFIAGGSWGPVVSFIFVVASAVGGSEAVVVAGGAYRSGLSGVWYYWHPLFAVPVYFLFSTIYKRSRVFNLAEFFAMRYGHGVAMLYAFLGMGAVMLDMGTCQLAVGKIVSGLTGLSVDQAVLAASVVAALCVASGGQMSTVLTDLFMGVLVLTVYTFLILPFVWSSADGFHGLRQLPTEFWSLSSRELSSSYILALTFSSSLGAVVGPALFSWIVVGKDERTATQCAWGHLWKRGITLLFALYGMLFVISKPGLADAELAWGVVMKEIIPVGVQGLLVAGFFAALMSTVNTMATAGSALSVDYIFKRQLFPERDGRFYLRCARISAFLFVFLSYLLTRQFSNLVDFIEVVTSFLGFLCVPLYFGIVWRKSNRQGMWAALLVGVALLMITRFWLGLPFQYTVFIPMFSSALTMYWVSRVTGSESEVLLNRFYCTLHTPLGQEDRLMGVGIRLPAMRGQGQAGEPEPTEKIDEEALAELYRAQSSRKIFGSNSSIELVKEDGMGWYYRGFVLVLLACFALLGVAWLGGKIMASLSLAK